MSTTDGVYVSDISNHTYQFYPLSGIVAMSSNIGTVTILCSWNKGYSNNIYLHGTFTQGNASVPAVGSLNIFTGNYSILFHFLLVRELYLFICS